MSWDVDVTVTVDGEAVVVFEANYTYNTNRMVRDAGWPEFPDVGPLSSDELGRKLASVLDAMGGNRRRFEAMNPGNGWGSYESLFDRLSQMRVAAVAHPTATWRFYG